jgi:hypothetical protein
MRAGPDENQYSEPGLFNLTPLVTPPVVRLATQVERLVHFLAELKMDPMQTDGTARSRPYTLRHGNPPGDPSSSPRCGAKTRSGTPCRAPAMWSKNLQRYTRCRLHGGASTGPRTPEGLERCRRANWKHGEYSAEHKASRRKLRQFVRLIGAENVLLAAEVRAIIRERRRREAESVPLVVLYTPPTQ